MLSARLYARARIAASMFGKHFPREHKAREILNPHNPQIRDFYPAKRTDNKGERYCY
jgi:hypothetical protein